jgi:type IV pilus assembly protein PilE
MSGPRNHRRPRGFTLIELSIALVIIGILASLAVITYNKYANKARFTQAQTALKHLQKTQTIYFTENGAFADNVVLLDFEPTKYDFYTISVILDNTGFDFTGRAEGYGAMAGDRWHINKEGNPIHDTPNF